MLETSDQTCPNCNEPIELVIDCSVPNQSYIEDCQVCCRPMIVNVEVAFQNDFNVTVKAEDE